MSTLDSPGVEVDLELRTEFVEWSGYIDGQVGAPGVIEFDAHDENPTMVELDLELTKVGSHHAIADGVALERLERASDTTEVLERNLLQHGVRLSPRQILSEDFLQLPI